MLETRDALYYPYIHVREKDLNWLKATLLCFPHVYRMVPHGFELNDPPATRAFATIRGLGKESLLASYDLNRGVVYAVQMAFRQRLLEDTSARGPAFFERFTRSGAIAFAGGNDSSFQIHRDKVSGELLEELLAKKLAWAPSDPNRGTDQDWIAVHPSLGEALMSTIAAAIANDEGLSIVTSTGKMHRALVTRDVNAVYDSLILGRFTDGAPDDTTVVDELTQLVVYSRFDLDALTPQKIAEMTGHGDGLFRLKKAREAFTADLPKSAGYESRERRLRQAADQVIARWQDEKAGMSKLAREFFSGKELLNEAKTFLSTVAKSAVAGSAAGGAGTAIAAGGGAGGAAATGAVLWSVTSTAVLGAVAGLAIGVVFYTGTVVANHYIRRAHSPFRYLTQLEKAGAMALVIKPPVGEAV